jgi:hypothetical protein
VADIGEDDSAAVERRPAVRRKAPASANGGARPAIVDDGASLAADHVGLDRSAVGRVEADTVEIRQGAVGAARVEHLSADLSAVGAVMAGNAEVSRSYVRSILARQVQLDRGAARVVIAADVRANQSAVMFLVARRVSGEMRVLLDWRGALAFGAAAGVVFAFLSRLRRGKQA